MWDEFYATQVKTVLLNEKRNFLKSETFLQAEVMYL